MKNYKTIIIIMILIAIGIIYYYYLSANNRVESKKNSSEETEIQKLINKDLENNYPATPREVVDFFSRVLTCYYEGNCSDDELMSLVLQTRKMFDDELLDRNPIDEYVENLKAEIKQYREENEKISSYIIEKNGEIEYKTFQSHYYSMVDCVYYIKGDAGTTRTMETYTLRKDSNGKWKILYWSLMDNNDED